MDEAKTLSDFIRKEMEKRHMRAYNFAEFVDVSHTTINKFLGDVEEDTGYPSMEFLIKLATATQTDIRYLVTLVVPSETIFNENFQPEIFDLSRRISKLPPEYRKIVEVIIAAGLEDQ